jgi:small GTP-binding protein
LKAKLAKLRNDLLVEQSGGSGGTTGEGFDVARLGDARVALIGFPSVGKSSLLGQLTGTESETADYEFTTLTCIPGTMRYKGSKVQVLDLPGIIEGAAHGKGRGREVIAVARNADAILIVLDAGKEGLNRHREILEKELETVGIRLNQRPPDVTMNRKKTGGIKFASTVPLTKLGPDPVKVATNVLREYKVSNADILAREDITVDQLVDVIQGNREYKPCLYLYNKIDTVTIEEIDQLARMPHSVVGSVSLNFNIGRHDEDDLLKQKMWEYLGLTRIYTKRKGQQPDLNEPVVLSIIRKGTKVRSLCANVSTQLLRDFNYALVWGMSAKHSPQRCGLAHDLDDEDVVQIVTKTNNQQRQDKNYQKMVQGFADKYHKKKYDAKKQKQTKLRG